MAPLNLPLPFIWALSPFFPSGAPHTSLPRGRQDPWPERFTAAAPSTLASLRLCLLRLQPRASRGLEDGGLVHWGSALVCGDSLCPIPPEPVFSTYLPAAAVVPGGLPDAPGARVEAPGLAFKPKWLQPVWGPRIGPSLLLPLHSRPLRTRQGRIEEAGGAPEPSLEG